MFIQIRLDCFLNCIIWEIFNLFLVNMYIMEKFIVLRGFMIGYKDDRYVNYKFNFQGNGRLLKKILIYKIFFKNFQDIFVE